LQDLQFDDLTGLTTMTKPSDWAAGWPKQWLLLWFLLLIGTAHSLSEHCYIALYKPALTLCSLNDDGPRAARKHREKRSTLKDLSLPDGLHICGRLDRDSEGLLLLTDNGQFTHQVLSEACHKKYWALVQGEPDEAALDEMRRGGLEIRGAITRPPLHVGQLEMTESSLLPPACVGMNRQGTWLEFVLNEGRNRQVRRVTAAAGHETVRLVRVAIASLSLLDDPLQPGEWKAIQPNQVVKDESALL
jgi:23S rRNA pseudouridine2457 synthase